MTIYDTNSVIEYLQKSDKIENIKVTSVKPLQGFCEYEGYTFTITVKIVFKNGRYKLLKLQENSTFFEWYDIAPKTDDFQEWLYCAIGY